MTIKELENKVKADKANKETTVTKAPKSEEQAKVILAKGIKKTLITEPTKPECILYLMKDGKALCKRTFNTKQDQIEWYKTSVTKLNSCDSYVSRAGNLITIMDAVVKPEKKPHRSIVTLSQASMF